MDFELTNDQQELRDAVRAVLATACPPSMVRQVYESKADDGASRAAPLWRQMVQLDWPALTIPEPFGGLGLGYVELAVVVEELGRAVAPTPPLSARQPNLCPWCARPARPSSRTRSSGLSPKPDRRAPSPWPRTTVAGRQPR
jgi:alkylation response protein AidB-like acyl-CoA dehydrogenase